MKRTKIIISTLVLAGAISIGIISDSHAIKLCQLDWFAVWQSKSGTLSNSGYAWTRSNFNSSHTGYGTWAVTSDEGSPGVKHTVGGISQCGTPTATVTGLTSYPNVSTTVSENINCFCKMTSPNLGGAWVFLLDDNQSAAHCAYYCADRCARCVLTGNYGSSCDRSAVLELP